MPKQETKFEPVFAFFEVHKAFFTRPLVQLFTIGVRKAPEPHGTAVAVKHGGRTHLVSASHCFDPLRKGEPLLAFADNEQQLTGQLRTARIIDPTDDPLSSIDLAILRLDDASVPRCKPVESTCFLPQSPCEEDTFLLVTGFPASKTKVNTQSKTARADALAHISPSIRPDEYQQLGLNPLHQIAMRFHTSKVLHSSGEYRRAPNPSGMSGSPIWTPGEINGNEYAFGITGILTDYKANDGLLVGTTIAAAIGVLRDFESEAG